MNTLTYKARLHKILKIMPYDIVDIGHHHSRGQQISHSIQMSAKEEFATEIFIVNRRIFTQVDYVRILKDLREAIKQFSVKIVSILSPILALGAWACHEKNATFGADLPNTLDDLRVISNKSIGIIMPIVKIDISLGIAKIYGFVGRGIMGTGHVIDTESDDICLRCKLGIPKVF